MKAGFVIIICYILLISCSKLSDYFREPGTNSLIETMQAASLTGYSANLAMSVIEGYEFPNVHVISRSNTGFPCTAVMLVDPADSRFTIAQNKTGSIYVVGLWPDATTAILSLVYCDYHAGTETLDLLGLETIPVIRDGDNIHLALASQEIQLNPDQDSFLSINLSTLEVESELFRLEMPRPSDVYVAVTQKAYFIDVDNRGTSANPDDDSYVITGGGQLVEIDNNAAEIVQQAMIEVRITSTCSLNPVTGLALVKVTGIDDNSFPELGTALFEFSNNCDGQAKILLATGMYISSNGQRISFALDQ